MAKLIKTEYTLSSDRIKVPLRLALASDLHDGARAAEDGARMLREDPPELLCIVGDLYESPPRNPFSVEHALTFLRGLPSGLRVLYCRGNHDESRDEKIDRALYDLHATELDGSSVRVGEVSVGGLRSALYRGGVPDLEFLSAFEKEEGFKLLLCHHPEYFVPYIKPTGIELTVCGHAHGGQWRFFGQGIYSPHQGLFPKYTAGIYDGRFIINRGAINNSKPIPRFFNPCEILEITLMPE